MSKTKNKKSHSSYWLGDFWSDEQISKSFAKADKKNHDLHKLAQTKRAISNFVRITTKQNIPVRFNNGGNSYTDGKTVVLSTTFETPQDFDVAAGLALHEAMHIVDSDFYLVRNIADRTPRRLVELSLDKGVKNYISCVKDCLNWVEDRRIDYLNYKAAPGYRGYYDAMYGKYFLSPNIDKGLISNEKRTETMDSYMFRLINLHNPLSDLDALNGLREIFNRVNLKKIGRLKSTEDAWDMALDIYEIIIENIDKQAQEEKNEENQKKSENGDESEQGSSDGNGGGGGSQGEGEEEPVSLTDEEFDDLIEDMKNGEVTDEEGGTPIQLTPEQKEKLEEAIEAQTEFMDGNVEKEELTNDEAREISSIEESGTEIKNVAKNERSIANVNGVDVIVVHKMTEQLMLSPTFPISTRRSTTSLDKQYFNDVMRGFKIGKMIGKKLQVRGESRTTVYNRQKVGRIDKRMISSLGFGNENVFQFNEVDAYKKANLHISIDASGSMSGGKWSNTITNVTALCVAIDMIPNLEVQVSFRSTQSSKPYVVLAYDSRTDKISKVKKLFPALDAGGTTPEGLCFEAIMDEFLPSDNSTDSYFLNLSDGMPWFSNYTVDYSGRAACEHTRKMVSKIRNRGISVLSYYIGSGAEDSDFNLMYGKSAKYINVTNVGEVTKTMNRLFLNKDKD